MPRAGLTVERIRGGCRHVDAQAFFGVADMTGSSAEQWSQKSVANHQLRTLMRLAVQQRSQSGGRFCTAMSPGKIVLALWLARSNQTEATHAV